MRKGYDLLDGRAKASGGNGGPLAATTVTIGCEESAFHRQYQADDLIRFYGRDYWQTYLRYDLGARPKGKRFRECGVRYVK